MSTISPVPLSNLTYEQALIELESIVTALETGQNPLDETVELFQRGQALAAYCAALLDQAELKIQQLAGEALSSLEPEQRDTAASAVAAA